MPLNMQKLLIYLLSLFVRSAVAHNFCKSNYNLSYVFIIGDQITFGTKGFRWKYDLKDKSVISLPSDDSSDESVTYVAFDFDPCKHQTQQFCNNSANAKNLVLHMSSNKYSAYRISCVNKGGKDFMSIPINDEFEMPWKLLTRGTVSEDKFFTHSNADITYTGLTFVNSNNTYALFASTVRQTYITPKFGNILVKRIDKLGVIDTVWSIAYNGVFRGLFDANGGVYALDNKNIFHLLELDTVSNKLIEKSKYNPKELFNCYQNSSLMSETFNMCDEFGDNTEEYEDETTGYGETTSQIIDKSNNSNLNEPVIISTTTSSEKHSLVWWSVLMIMLVVALIITAIIYFIFGKKSKKQMSTKSVNKQINDEKSLESKESTLRTENDSINSDSQSNRK